MEFKGDQSQQVKVLQKEFSTKFRTKGEVYRFLDSDVDAYLAPKECVTIYFLKDLLTGKRKFFHKNTLKPVSVPQFEGLSIECILERGREHPELDRYLPEDRDMERLPRNFIATVVRGLLKKDFDRWVEGVIEKRNEALRSKQKLEILMTPEIHALFQKSKMISTENGRASHMLKVGTKRRRTNAQIEADHNQQKFEEIDARDSKVKMSEKDQKIADLEAELAQVHEKNEKGIWAGGWLEEQIEQKNIAVTQDNQLIITTGVNTIANGDDLMNDDGN